MRLKYNYDYLHDYITKNNVTLTKDYSKIHLNKESTIEAYCKGENCSNTFDKTIYNLINNNKPYCINCLKIERRKKLHQNNISKYGCINVLQTKENIQKSKDTIMKKYGVYNISQNEEIKKKKIETLIKNYGVDHTMKSPELREKIKNTNLKKFGVENVSQNPEISKKQNKYNQKIYLFPSGFQIKYQGYENFAFDMLLKENIDENKIVNERVKVPKIWYYDENNVKRLHFVDIYIPSLNRCIEVKSMWTLKKHYNKVFAKQKAAKKENFEYHILVFSEKGELLEKYE